MSLPPSPYLPLNSSATALDSWGLACVLSAKRQCLSIWRGIESAGLARMSVVKRADAGVDKGSPGYVRTVPVEGLFGFFDLPSGPFLAVIRRSKLR